MNKIGLNMGSVKQQNRALILNHVNRHGPVSRKDIARATGLTAASVTQIVNKLISEGILTELGVADRPSRSAGRKKILVDIKSDTEYVLAVNIEPDVTNVALCDLKARPVVKRSGEQLVRTMDTDTGVPALVFLERVAEECASLRNALPVKYRSLVRAVSVGINGIVDTETGVSMRANGIWKDEVDIRGIMNSILGLPTYVENNVDAFATAELLFGAGRKTDNLLIIKWGPGVGSTIVINDDIYRGRLGRTAEIGHLIVDPNGKECACGRRGCLETKTSYKALNEIMPFDIETFEESYDKADAKTKKRIDEAIDLFARCIVNAATIIAPRRIILYGKLFRNKTLRDRVIEACSAYDPAYGPKRMLHTSLSASEGYIGPAAVYVQDRLRTI